MTIEQRRAAVRAALERLERAATAIDALNDESTDEQRTAAGDEFDGAQAAHDLATTELRRAEAVAEARRNAPPPAPDSGAEERNAGGGLRVTREPLTYDERHNPNRNSYFLDIARVHTGRGLAGAADRLERHRREQAEEIERREQAAERGYDQEIGRMLEELPGPLARALERSGLLERGVRRGERRDLSRTDGSGGHFVPPIWLMDRYAEAARAGRPFVEALNPLPLPGGTDTINVPKITGGTATAIQTADNQPVQKTDLTDSVATASVRTIAGQQDIALQLLDQSPVNFDEIAFRDLIADYAFQTETQGIAGSGSSGQVKGILTVATASGNIITYTDASPTVPELYPKVANALATARALRKRPITHGWFTPTRGYWLTSALDSSNRPLVVPQVLGPNNAMGLVEYDELGGGSGEDRPINIHGIDHRMTDAIPANLGAGTNEDRIIETRMADHLWWEGTLNSRAIDSVLSNTLEVRLQVYAYVAATFERFPAGISVVAGTGLATPTF
jgi:HK97 family phage major capsid protein